MTDLKIEFLGRRGDGIAKLNGKDVFVPFSLSGETVSVSGKGPRFQLETVQQASPDRIEPKCQHFQTCGGCQLQHMAQSPYEDWKRELVDYAFKQAGLTAIVDEFISFPEDGRRKAVFSAARLDGQLAFGFLQSESHTLIDISECPVLSAGLAAQIEPLKEISSSLPLGKKPARVSVLETSNGLDVSIEDLRDLNDSQIQALTRKSVQLDFARLSVNGEILIETRSPFLKMGSAKVVSPPGGFVQASEQAEAAMVKIVCDHLSSCKTVADLYCGIGTFALRLAERSKVVAYEESSLAINALDKAWRETGGKLKQLVSETRNLDRRPVLSAELKRVDGVVFDPPRAGAEIQVRQLMRSKVKHIAAVSCNPTTLARDVKLLVDAGFEIKKVYALDQFQFTPHVECIALLGK